MLKTREPNIGSSRTTAVSPQQLRNGVVTVTFCALTLSTRVCPELNAENSLTSPANFHDALLGTFPCSQHYPQDVLRRAPLLAGLAGEPWQSGHVTVRARQWLLLETACAVLPFISIPCRCCNSHMQENESHPGKYLIAHFFFWGDYTFRGRLPHFLVKSKDASG